MVTKAGLAVLDALSTGQEATPEELATETGCSKTYLYSVLDDLQSAGLLAETRTHRNQRRVRATTHPVVEAYRTLASTLNHIEWADLLSPATLRVCWYLDEPRRITEIAARLTITRQGVHNALAPLKHRAMLSPAGPEYALIDDLEPLLEFARTLVIHEHRTRVRALAPSATIIWCDPERALVRVQTPEDTETLESTDDWQHTGLAKFRAYDLPFFLAGEPAFWHAPNEELAPATVVCHTLAIERDTRRVSYAMLLIENLKIAQEALTETAAWYGLADVVGDLYRPLDEGFDSTEGSRLPLPSEAEYMALKEQYGVK